VVELAAKVRPILRSTIDVVIVRLHSLVLRAVTIHWAWKDDARIVGSKAP
jgi:hypothetical protein